MGAFVAMDANPQTASVRLEAEGEVKLSSSEIAIPRLKVKAPGFDLSFPGGRITKDSIEIFDAPPVPIFGVEIDLERASFRKGEFATNYASVGTDTMSLSLRDLTIGNNGLGIGGGGFKYFGFGIDVSARSVNDALCLGANITGIPLFGNAGLDFCIESGNKLRIERAALPNITLGPVSIRNAVFVARNDLLFFTADVGFSSWKFAGAVELESGKLKKVSLDGDFTNMPGGGYILWSVPPIYLNSIGASVYPMEARIQGRVVLCLLTAIQIPIVGTCTLAGLNGQAEFNGSLGYVRADADIQAFARWNSDAKRWKGIELAAATAIAGNVYLDGKFRGLGAYASGRMNFFGFIEGTQTGQVYSTGNLDAKLNGSLKIPGGIPVIGGKTFANVEAVLRNNSDGPFFKTEVNIDVPIPPLPYQCGWSTIKRCNNICHWAPWPFDDWCETLCETVRVPKICLRTHVNWGFGITIDSNPPYLHDIRLWKDEQGLQTFDNGYHADTGMTVLTNYQCLARKSLLKDGSISKYADATEAKIIPFDYYPESKSDRIINQNTRQAIFRYDFTEFEGDANISLRFPDGTLYRWDDENIPRFSPDMVFEKQMDIGDVAISYYHNVYDDGEQKMKEAGFICNGPYVFEKQEVIGEGGEPTGSFKEIFVPGPLPYGRYEIIVEATEKADQGALDILGKNNLPELLYAKVEPLEPLEQRHYKISWQVNDEDGNPTVVRLHLVNNTDDPELGVLLGTETV
ncbi:MAG TPA: hypothetical protein PLC40_10475, partial [Candidatus Hydrogenedentes bacterium]|nr:hypothetical protein [Candidatus Hydrogenedentota bacterium]